MARNTDSIDALTSELRAFNAEREWEQFHAPRNLVLALLGEAGEVAAELQWVSDADVRGWLADRANKERLAAELADVFAYLLQLADTVEIPLGQALEDKIAVNRERYPVERFRANSARYDQPTTPGEAEH